MFEKMIDPSLPVSDSVMMCTCPTCSKVETVEQRGAGLFCRNCKHSYVSVPKNSPELTMVGGGLLAIATFGMLAIANDVNTLTGVAFGLMYVASIIVMVRGFRQTLRQRREISALTAGHYAAEDQGYRFVDGNVEFAGEPDGEANAN